MDEEHLLEELLRAAVAVGVKVHRRNLEGPEGLARSGLVMLRGSPIILLHQGLSRAEQIEVLLDSMREFDLESIYLSPACRSALDCR